MMRFATTTILLLTCLAALSACGSLSRPDPAVVEQLRLLPFPAAATPGPDLDVLVEQHGQHVTLSNRTAHEYQNVHLWLNRQYVAAVPGIPIGESDVPLGQFINRYGESFPVGGVLTPDKGRPVVSADIFDPASGVRHALVVHYQSKD